MTSPQFDNLMSGDMAKFAPVTLDDFNSRPLMAAMLAVKQVGATDTDIDNARNEIEKVQVEIPDPMRFKIDMFIKQQREKGNSERSIRRMVQNKFNIQVV